MDPIAQAADDIRTMRVRGAAKIGRHAVAALGQLARAGAWRGDLATLDSAETALLATRPTAVSLRNAVQFATRRARRAPEAERARALAEAADAFEARAKEALAAIGRHGAALVPDGGRVLTICNSQGALEPMREAWRQGKRFEVVALETRPWRQGLLTVRQLHDAGVPASLAVDSAAWLLLKDADLVLVGSDTLAANGDVVNKVGTGGVAVLARERGVPFHCCAETFKVDLRAPTGDDVLIEEREAAEVVKTGEVPEGVRILNPVFDVTPAALVRSHVTELGALKPSDLAPAARKAWELE
jgi:ribose 1,5-bisphosphate isomerase